MPHNGDFRAKRDEAIRARDALQPISEPTVEEKRGRPLPLERIVAIAAGGIINALLAISATHRALAGDTRKIRQQGDRWLELFTSPDTARLGLTGVIVPKHSQGGIVMAGPFNPTEQQDVDFAIAPVNAAGQPTNGPFDWTRSDATAGELVVAPDTKSAKLVTNPGAVSCIVTVTDPRTSVGESALVERTVVPPDNNTTAMNLSGSVVPK